jgi:hypothetical protein
MRLTFPLPYSRAGFAMPVPAQRKMLHGSVSAKGKGGAETDSAATAGRMADVSSNRFHEPARRGGG